MRTSWSPFSSQVRGSSGIFRSRSQYGACSRNWPCSLSTYRRGGPMCEPLTVSMRSSLPKGISSTGGGAPAGGAPAGRAVRAVLALVPDDRVDHALRYDQVVLGPELERAHHRVAGAAAVVDEVALVALAVLEVVRHLL